LSLQEQGWRPFDESWWQTCIRTNDGYVIPLDIQRPTLSQNATSHDAEMNALPHVIFTSGDEWNPTILITHLLTKKIGITS
jgi:hypothetical protein